MENITTIRHRSSYRMVNDETRSERTVQNEQPEQNRHTTCSLIKNYAGPLAIGVITGSYWGYKYTANSFRNVICNVTLSIEHPHLVTDSIIQEQITDSQNTMFIRTSLMVLMALGVFMMVEERSYTSYAIKCIIPAFITGAFAFYYATMEDFEVAGEGNWRRQYCDVMALEA